MLGGTHRAGSLHAGVSQGRLTKAELDLDLDRFQTIDDRLAMAAIAGNYGSVVAVAILAHWIAHWAVTAAAIIVIAGRQMAIQNLLHAAAHRSLFSNRKANDHVDLFLGFPLFDTVRSYRSGHLRHHRDVTRKEPDRFDYIEIHLAPPQSPLWRRTWKVVLGPLLGAAGWRFIRNTAEALWEEPRFAGRLAAYWLAAGGGFYLTGGLSYLVLYWLFPLVWLYPIFDRWAAITDHHATRDEARNQRGFFYSFLLKGHEMYHAVHHIYPHIPFYRMRAAHRHLAAAGFQMEETRGIRDFIKILHRDSSLAGS